MCVTYVITSQPWFSLGSHPSWSTLERRRPLLVYGTSPISDSLPWLQPLTSAALHLYDVLNQGGQGRRCEAPSQAPPP